MKALIGKKLGMTQIFDAEGNVVQATVIEAGPCMVTQVKNPTSDGYSAVQLGFGVAKRQSRPQMGHLKAANANPSVMREFRLDGINSSFATATAEADEATEAGALKVGDKLDVTVFEIGDKVQITGITKGKGFAGTVKRHNFSIGPKSHGSRNQRKHGSIGSMFPEKVFRGLRMAGQMGNVKSTVRNLTVVAVDQANNILAVRGAVPGPAKGTVIIKAIA